MNRNTENRPPPFYPPKDPSLSFLNNNNNSKNPRSLMFPKRNGEPDQIDDPLPTPNSNLALVLTPTEQETNHNNNNGIFKPCAECGTSLQNYRHKLLKMEKELEWQKQNMQALLDTQDRAKKDKMNMFSTLLQENHILKLGVGVNDVTADIERGKLVSLVNQTVDRVDSEILIQRLKEDLRKAHALRHRQESNANIIKRDLQAKVGKLQDSLSHLQKSSSEEIDTLKNRLQKMRLGAQVQDLQRVAVSARNMRASVNRLRASVSDLVENGPLSANNLRYVNNHVDETVENYFFKLKEDEEEGKENNLKRREWSPKSNSLNFPSGGMEASLSMSLQQQQSKSNIPVAASNSNNNNASEIFSQQIINVEDTNMKDLCNSLINYWGGDDENPLMVELATTLEGKMKQQQQNENGDDEKDKDDNDENNNTTSNTTMTESDRCRSALYQTVTMLTDALRGAFGHLEKEKAEKEVLQRHLTSFKQQLKQIRDNLRPESQDAETMCEYEEFVPVFDDREQLLDSSSMRPGSAFSSSYNDDVLSRHGGRATSLYSVRTSKSTRTNATSATNRRRKSDGVNSANNNNRSRQQSIFSDDASNYNYRRPSSSSSRHQHRSSTSNSNNKNTTTKSKSTGSKTKKNTSTTSRSVNKSKIDSNNRAATATAAASRYMPNDDDSISVASSFSYYSRRSSMAGGGNGEKTSRSGSVFNVPAHHDMAKSHRDHILSTKKKQTTTTKTVKASTSSATPKKKSAVPPSTSASSPSSSPRQKTMTANRKSTTDDHTRGSSKNHRKTCGKNETNTTTTSEGVRQQRTYSLASLRSADGELPVTSRGELLDNNDNEDDDDHDTTTETTTTTTNQNNAPSSARSSSLRTPVPPAERVKQQQTSSSTSVPSTPNSVK